MSSELTRLKWWGSCRGVKVGRFVLIPPSLRCHSVSYEQNNTTVGLVPSYQFHVTFYRIMSLTEENMDGKCFITSAGRCSTTDDFYGEKEAHLKNIMVRIHNVWMFLSSRVFIPKFVWHIGLNCIEFAIKGPDWWTAERDPRRPSLFYFMAASLTSSQSVKYLAD